MVNKNDKKNKHSNENEENNDDNKNKKLENKNERPNSSPAIQNTSIERIISPKKNISKLRKEELMLKQQKRSSRKRSEFKNQRSSMSLLSYLISEETIHAAKICEDEKRKPSCFENINTNNIPAQRGHLVTINEPDDPSLSSSSRTNYKYDSLPSTAKKSSKISVADSGKILSYLLSTQSLPKMAAIVDDETEPNELLLGYRNRKTNEMKLTVVPADCFVIYQEDEPSKTFTIVIIEEDQDKSEFEYPVLENKLEKEKDNDLTAKKSILKAVKNEPFDTRGFSGYINPSWPKKKN